MRPDIWGKYLWISMHFIAMEYPHRPTKLDRENYRTFFEKLRDVIPCVTCANNYADHLIKFPLDDRVLDNRMNLFRWTVDMHNEVNKITNKKTVSYEKAVEIYTKSLVDRNDTIGAMLSSHVPTKESRYIIQATLFVVFIIAICLTIYRIRIAFGSK
jgi:hypothetical protein